MLRPALCALTFSLALPLAALPAAADQVTVFAAASLKNALDEIAADFIAETGHDVAISYAGSNALARQIIEGAPADLFISANVEWLDQVEAQGLVDSRTDLLGNRLVLIGHGDAEPVQISAATDLAAMLDGGKLAMAMVDSVPAGQYGKAALETLGLWDDLRDDVAQSDNVRAALMLVSTGEAPLGIVYATDAAAGDNVTIIGEFPQDSYPPITYPAALLDQAEDQADRDFFQALGGSAAAEIFARHGFSVQ